MAKQHFQSIGGLKPRRTAFDLSHEYKTTCKMGQLIPVLVMDCIPGDSINLWNEIVLRFQPMLAPILHMIDVYTHTFFVPYRLLWGSVHSLEFYPDEPVRAWEKFSTGDKNNTFSTPQPLYVPAENNVRGKLWDYFGFHVNTNGAVNLTAARDNFYPVDWPRRSYNFIWNEYYRDQDLQEKIHWNNEEILYRCWEKDYFTIARPIRQRGQAMAIPLTGNARVRANTLFQNAFGSNPSAVQYNASGTLSNLGQMVLNPNLPTVANLSPAYLFADMTDGVGSFSLHDVRQIAQITKWQERNARAGVRYKEFIPAHYGVTIGDARLDRPEYIGGTKSPVLVSEVLQTSETSSVSPQANMSGHGLAADNGRIGKYFVREFGLIMTLLSVRPRTSYSSGINRQWLHRSRYELPFPEFAHLSEQGIYKGELIMDSAHDNQWNVWGYQGIYDEYRYLQSKVTKDMRQLLRYWHLSRYAPPDVPVTGTKWPLNGDFVKCKPREDIFAVLNAPDPNNAGAMVPVDNLIVNYGARIKAVRPIPFIAEPGLIDHF